MKLIKDIAKIIAILPLLASCSLNDDPLMKTSYTYVNDTSWDITIETYSDTNSDAIYTLNRGDATLTLSYYSEFEFISPFKGKSIGDSIIIKTKDHIIIQEVKINSILDDLYDKESYIQKETDDNNREFIYIFNDSFFE